MSTKPYSRERLIDEVKKYPVLYDTKHEHHRDIDVRDRCWQEISERIGANSKCSYRASDTELYVARNEYLLER